MRIAVVCDPPDAVLVHKPSWVAAGFRAAGHSVVLVHDLAGVRAADESCDLILFDHKASGLNRAGLAELAHCRLSLRERTLLCERPFAERKATIWLQWWRDLIATDPTKPLVDQDHFRAFAAVMRGMDMVFIKERSLLDEYHQLGINAHWLDQACPADMSACQHLPLPPGEGWGGGRGAAFDPQNVPVPISPERPDWDVLVLGSTSYAQRRFDARALADAGFRVLWAGMAGSDPVPLGVEWHPCVHPLNLPELVSRCGVVLGVDWRSDLAGYTSDRTYLACGIGGCYVARCNRAIADESPQAALGAWIYDKTNELIEIVRAAMSDTNKRRRRGERSRQIVMQHHTYAHRAAEIVNLIAPKVRDSTAQGAAQRNPG